MNAPAIVLGDPNSILQLPKAPLTNAAKWTQLDSDVLAHLIQVNQQILRSRWYKSDTRFSTKGHKLLDHAFPAFEDFVFAAVYLRQLIAQKDSLLEDAATRYCRFVDCQLRRAWVTYELQAFRDALSREMCMVSGYTARQVFDAFLYGAALFHKIPKLGESKRKLFLDIYDAQPRHVLLFDLHATLKSLMNHVASIAAVIYRDYSHWLFDNNLPLPDIRWHNKLFEIGCPDLR